jgi:hypothetical protein
MSFISKLNFQKSKTVFEDGSKMVEATLKGNFNRDDLLKNINNLAKEFNSKHVQLGIAAHYKKVNKWGPSLISESNKHIAVWDPSDSPETEEAYRNDVIDHIHVFVIEDKKEPVLKKRKPKNEVMFK